MGVALLLYSAKRGIITERIPSHQILYVKELIFIDIPPIELGHFAAYTTLTFVLVVGFADHPIANGPEVFRDSFS